MGASETAELFRSEEPSDDDGSNEDSDVEIVMVDCKCPQCLAAATEESIQAMAIPAADRSGGQRRETMEHKKAAGEASTSSKKAKGKGKAKGKHKGKAKGASSKGKKIKLKSKHPRGGSGGTDSVSLKGILVNPVFRKPTETQGGEAYIMAGKTYVCGMRESRSRHYIKHVNKILADIRAERISGVGQAKALMRNIV